MRSGKSSLMNALMDAPSFFDVQGGEKSCTVGADISHFLSADTLSSAAVLTGPGAQRPFVAFVDAEGQGGMGDNYDTTLLTPLCLVSKAVLFNWKGSTGAQSDMLEKLGVLIKAAQRIAPPTEAGDAASHTTLLGHLHIVVRDSYNNTTEDVWNIIVNHEDGEGNEVAERNTIRRLLQASFADISVRLLPSPMDSMEKLKTNKFSEGDMTDAFKQAVAGLKNKLVEQMQEPRILGGRRLTCDAVARQMVEMAKELNENGPSIHPGSNFARMDAEDIRDMVSECLASFDDVTVAHILARLPIPPNVLEEEVQTEGTLQKSALREAFPNALGTTVSNGENMIQEHCEKALATLMRKNEEAIKNAMWLMVSERLAYFDEVIFAKLQAELPCCAGVLEDMVNREGTLLKSALREAFPYASNEVCLDGERKILWRTAKALSTLKSKNEVYNREDEAFKRVRGRPIPCYMLPLDPSFTHSPPFIDVVQSSNGTGLVWETTWPSTCPSAMVGASSGES